MKKQKILVNLFAIIALLIGLTGSTYATNGVIQNTQENIIVNNENTTDSMDAEKEMLGQTQLNKIERQEHVESIKEKIVIVIIAITLALIVILVMWKYEF